MNDKGKFVCKLETKKAEDGGTKKVEPRRKQNKEGGTKMVEQRRWNQKESETKKKAEINDYIYLYNK